MLRPTLEHLDQTKIGYRSAFALDGDVLQMVAFVAYFIWIDFLFPKTEACDLPQTSPRPQPTRDH
jgi:hypothetical protein